MFKRRVHAWGKVHITKYICEKYIHKVRKYICTVHLRSVLTPAELFFHFIFGIPTLVQNQLDLLTRTDNHLKFVQECVLAQWRYHTWKAHITLQAYTAYILICCGSYKATLSHSFEKFSRARRSAIAFLSPVLHSWIRNSGGFRFFLVLFGLIILIIRAFEAALNLNWQQAMRSITVKKQERIMARNHSL